MILRQILAILLTVFGIELAYIHEIDAAHSGPHGYTITVTPSGGTGTLRPLTAGSLTTNRGTVTFAKSQGRYGFNVLLNGVTMGIQATALQVASGLLVARYDTGLPSGGPQSLCMKETTEITNISTTMAAFTAVTCPAGI